jgi:hypothetical protein
VPTSLTDAGGRLLTANEVANCFSCHATGAVVAGSQLRLDKFAHGIRCEACHGPGGQHIAAVKAGDTPAKSIYNPRLLGGDDDATLLRRMSSWHRRILVVEEMEINNVRFQP